MALRPRLSAGLPLSNEQMIRFQKKEPGYLPGSPRTLKCFRLRQPGYRDPGGTG